MIEQDDNRGDAAQPAEQIETRVIAPFSTLPQWGRAIKKLSSIATGVMPAADQASLQPPENEKYCAV